MSSPSIIWELEVAAKIVMGLTNEVTNEERHAAQCVLMNFRKTTSPYAICEQILEKSELDILIFEAANVLKNALITEWKNLSMENIYALRLYLLNYIVNKNLPSYIREKIIQVVAILIKRISLVDKGSDLLKFIEQIEALFKSGDSAQQFLACRLLNATTQEYMVTIKSDDTGLTFDEHYKAKKFYENEYLRRIFMMILNGLIDLVKDFDKSNIQHTQLMLQLLSIQELVFIWGYVAFNLPRRLIEVFESVNKIDQSVRLRLNAQWAPIILNPQLLTIFFNIYWKVRGLDELQQKAVNCLAQLATLNGGVFENEAASRAYAINYLNHFVQLCKSIQIQMNEAYHFATILRKFLSNTRLTDINCDEALFTSLIQQMFLFACNFAENAVLINEHDDGNCDYNEALNKILESWLIILQYEENFHAANQLIRQYSIEIFNKYLQCHLSPPNGLRRYLENGNIVYESEESDRVFYHEQLIIIGLLGRVNVKHSLQILCTLLEEKTKCIHHELCIFQNNKIYNNERLNTLFEDVHWLLLIASHVLSLDAEGEQPLIPSRIMEYSIDEINNGCVNVEMSLKVLASSPTQSINDIENAENTCDLVIRFIAAVFRLCEIENNALDANMFSILSPEVTSSIMWFLYMWSENYLLFTTEFYNSTSDALINAFALNTAGGNWTVNFILNKIYKNVYYYAHEKKVVHDSINLFVSFVRRKHKCETVFTAENFKKIISMKDLPNLPSKPNLLTGLILTSSCITDIDTQVQYLNGLLYPIRDSYNAIKWQNIIDDGVSNKRSAIAIKLVAILEEIKACNSGAKQLTAITIYSCFEQIIITLPDIMDAYHDFQIIIIAILELVCESLKHLIFFLPQHMFYELCINCIRVYFKHNSELKLDKDTEDDIIEIYVLLFKMMEHVLSKDFFDEPASDNALESGDVCIFGFTHIVPHVTTSNLLNYPAFCTEYYKAISFFLERKCHKLCIVPTNILSQMFDSLKLGLISFGNNIQSFCFEIVHLFAGYVYHDKNKESPIYVLLMPFPKIVIDMILLQELSTDNKSECSRALYTLICCYKDNFGQIIDDILSKFSEPTKRNDLSIEFQNLLSPTSISFFNNNRSSQAKFMENFSKFFINISNIIS